ncbi:MAG: cation transport ATPase [Acidobacteriales bacterium]|nr:cation transport ATPase [Terriglobales bacterium]
MCAHAVRVAMKSVKGVETVEVSLNKGLATMNLKPGNSVAMKQLLEAISKNGFTTKQSKVTANGVIVSESGTLKLKVFGSNDTFTLTGEPAILDQARKLVGKNVLATGTIGEVLKGKSVDSMQLTSIELAK